MERQALLSNCGHCDMRYEVLPTSKPRDFFLLALQQERQVSLIVSSCRCLNPLMALEESVGLAASMRRLNKPMTSNTTARAPVEVQIISIWWVSILHEHSCELFTGQHLDVTLRSPEIRTFNGRATPPLVSMHVLSHKQPTTVKRLASMNHKRQCQAIFASSQITCE